MSEPGQFAPVPRAWLVGLASAAALGSAAVAGPAHGHAPASLEWQAPAECDRATFSSRIPAAAEARPIFVHITHEPGAPRYEGTVRLGDPTAPEGDLSRTIAASTCKELAAALGLAAAMLLEIERERAAAPPAADAGTADAAREAEPASDSYDGGVRRKEVDAGSEPGRATWIAIGAGASAVSDALGPELRLGVHNGHALPGLGLGLGLDGVVRVLDVSRESYDLALRWIVARPSLCALGVVALGHFEVGLCAAAELGVSWVQHIEGPLDAETSQRVWFGAGALGRARYVSGSPRDRLRFTLGFEGSLLLVATRPTYRVEGGPTLLRTPPFSPNLSIFGGVQFR